MLKQIIVFMGLKLWEITKFLLIVASYLIVCALASTAGISLGWVAEHTTHLWLSFAIILFGFYTTSLGILLIIFLSLETIYTRYIKKWLQANWIKAGIIATNWENKRKTKN